MKLKFKLTETNICSRIFCTRDGMFVAMTRFSRASFVRTFWIACI